MTRSQKGSSFIMKLGEPAMQDTRSDPDFDPHGKDQSQEFQSITGTSKATATRDLQDLAEKHILIPAGGGRSTRYQINL